jgi:hypothetical protein
MGLPPENVEPEIDPFKGVVLLNHFTEWPREVVKEYNSLQARASESVLWHIDLFESS